MAYNLRCDAGQTRRLMDKGAGEVKNVDIDKLDNCSEVYLGLLTTFLVTALIWALALPFFDVAGMNWIKGWEGSPGEVSMKDFKDNVYLSFPATSSGVPMGAFQHMDENHDGMIVEPEMSIFLGSLQTPMNSTDQVEYIFNGLDKDQNHLITTQEWADGFKGDQFYYWKTTTTTTTTTSQAPPEVVPEPASTAPAPPAPPAPVPIVAPPPVIASKGKISMEQLLKQMGEEGEGSEAHTLKAFDGDGDGYAAHGEFIKGLSMLPQPIDGQQAEAVFDALDVNRDSVVDSEEWFKAFNSKHFLNTAPVVVTTTMPPNPLKVQALKDLGLTSPPITMQTLKEAMGSVTPEVAYQALDKDKNGEIDENEMIVGGKGFSPPLSDVEAKYAHRGVDINNDNKVVPAELYDSLKYGHFFPTIAQAQAAHMAR